MDLMARYLMANKSPFIVARIQELTTYETLKQCDGCIISTDVLGGSSALVKSTTDAPHVLSGFVIVYWYQQHLCAHCYGTNVHVIECKFKFMF